MKATRQALQRLIFLGAGSLALVGCGGGDVEISADDNSVVNDNSTTTSGGGSNNPCANYTDPASNTLKQGSFDGTNCTYTSDFVGENNPLTVDLTIPFISGVHIFEDSLFVGVNEDGLSGNPAPAGGTGPTLTIRAGATLAWLQSSDYLLINRGSTIIADGGPTAPITLTSFSDAVTGNAAFNAVAQWGGVVINGNGITNKCDDTQRQNGTCHILSEGKPSNYGGNDNSESSGILRYVVVKHTGFEVAAGDELNGITFNAVGSGTTVENIQVYSTFDDGVEFFGGAVNVNNLVALYVNDDSIDYADGFIGSVSNALVIHERDQANRCIEGDNQGGNPTAVPVTNPTIRNLTCIISAQDGGVHGDSEGVLIRVGAQSQIQDSIVSDTYARTLLARGGNECFEFDDAETQQRAQDGLTTVASTLITCEEATPGGDALPNGDTVVEWLTNTGSVNYAGNTDNLVITASDSANLVVLDGIFTAAALADDLGNPIAVTPVGGVQIGAVTRADDWTDGWTFGLTTADFNAGRLWFDPRP